MRRLRIQIWDETNEAEHCAPVSLTGKFRYYVLLSASNRCRTSPLWVGRIAHKQDQEEACDCSILCVSSKPSVSLKISWTSPQQFWMIQGSPISKRTYYHWWRLESSVFNDWVTFPRCFFSHGRGVAPSQQQPGCSHCWGCDVSNGFVIHWVPLVAESQAETAEVVTSLVWTQAEMTMIQFFWVLKIGPKLLWILN